MGRYISGNLENRYIMDEVKDMKKDIERLKDVIMKSAENLERMIATLNRRVTELESKERKIQEELLFDDGIDGEEASASYGGGMR